MSFIVITTLKSKLRTPSIVTNKGFFIVLEGIDGVGKSTTAKELRNYLETLGYETVLTREPRTDNEFGKKLRETTRNASTRLSAEEEVELFIKDRQFHLENIVRPALERGAIVITDRYYISNLAYQGSRGLDWRKIQRQNEEFALKPDLILLLDCDPEVSLERIKPEKLDDF